MKKIAQRTSAILFLLSFIKSFKYTSNTYDIVFIVLCVTVYLAYEFISDTKLKLAVEKLTIDTEAKFKEVEKDARDTKGYVSTMSIGTAFKR